MTELEKKHLSKKFDGLEAEMETPYALYLEGYKSGLFDALEEINKLPIHGVIHWVALKSNLKPNENTEECLVKYEDGKVRTALFSQEDFRFYNSMNSQDITEQIKYYSELPN